MMAFVFKLTNAQNTAKRTQDRQTIVGNEHKQLEWRINKNVKMLNVLNNQESTFNCTNILPKDIDDKLNKFKIELEQLKRDRGLLKEPDLKKMNKIKYM